MRRGAWAGCLLGLAAPALGAQTPETCSIVLDHTANFERVLVGTYTRQFFSGDVRAHCAGGTTRMASDSAAFFEDRDRMDFVGRVHFEDSTVTLDTDRALYFLTDERLEAYGNVRLVNRETGSVLTGANLVYRRAVAGVRDTSDMLARQRPTILYHSTEDSAGAEPYTIIGNQVRMRGDNRSWAGGSVTIDRSDFHADADSVELDLDAGEGLLLGHAHVRGEEADSNGTFRVSGREIAFRLTEGDLDWLQSRDGAEATSADWRLLADTLEFHIADNAVQGGLAWGDSTRAHATSALHTMVADSLAIDSPDQALREIRSFGHARSTSVRDSVDGEADWVAGDTVIARFDTSETGERYLAELDAAGHARALYRIFDPEQSEAEPNINYSRGETILARFDATGIQRVDVAGEADGVHLEPIGVVRRRNP